MNTTYAPVPATSKHDDDRVEVCCCGCGYGAVVVRLPRRCPMCGKGTWRPAAGSHLGTAR
jgi:hypothetical protein